MTGEKTIKSTHEPAPKDLNFGKRTGVIGSEKIKHQPPSKEPTIHSQKYYAFAASQITSNSRPITNSWRPVKVKPEKKEKLASSPEVSKDEE
ncbi:hypothetical protein ACSAZL_06365 [Methanosarcina sp. T3]|uniref:hypothetical protein n=1 Tax=Methanosarcina sp. T3 TaxID=3439062 RepID=UPI003F837C8C